MDASMVKRDPEIMSGALCFTGNRQEIRRSSPCCILRAVASQKERRHGKREVDRECGGISTPYGVS